MDSPERAGKRESYINKVARENSEHLKRSLHNSSLDAAPLYQTTLNENLIHL